MKDVLSYPMKKSVPGYALPVILLIISISLFLNACTNKKEGLAEEFPMQETAAFATFSLSYHYFLFTSSSVKGSHQGLRPGFLFWQAHSVFLSLKSYFIILDFFCHLSTA